MIRDLVLVFVSSVVLLCAAETAWCQTNALRLGTGRVPPGVPSSVSLVVDGVVGQPIGGLSYGVELPAGFVFTGFQDPIADFVGVSTGPGFFTVGILFSTSDLETRGPGFFNFGTLELSTPPIAEGDSIELPFTPGLGSPPVPVEFATVLGPVIPVTLSGGVVAASAPDSQFWVFSEAEDELQVIRSDGTLLPAISGGTAFSPRAVGVDPNGIAWVSFSGSNLIRRYDSSAEEVFVFGTSSTIATGSEPAALTIDRFGNCWVANTGDLTLSLIDPFGRVVFGGDGQPLDSPEDGVLGAALPVSHSTRGLASDPFGSVWAIGSDGMGGGSIARFNRSGQIAFDLAVGAADPTDVAVDRSGLAWITLRGADRVERRSSDGAIVRDFSVPAPFAIALRGGPTAATREAWVLGRVGAMDRVIRIAIDETISVFDSPSMVPLSGIVVDGAGRPWVTDVDGIAYRLDPESSPTALTVTAMATSIVGAEIRGDSSGYTQALIHFPDGNPAVRPFFDFDDDGFVNRLEITEGTDLFDALSSPAVPVVPVQGLECTVEALSATLSWSNAQSYDEIQVTIDGALASTLPGGSFGTAVLLPESGVFEIGVIGVSGGDSANPSFCTVVSGSGELLSQSTVVADGELVNPFDVAVTDRTDPGDPVFLITDPEARLVYRLDGNQQPIDSFSSDVFIGDFGASGVAFDPQGGTEGSIFLVGGKAGEQVEIVEVDVEGAPLPGAAALLIDDESGSPVLGQPRGLTLGRGATGPPILLFGGQDGCEIFAVLAAGSGTIEPDLSFVHPEPGFAGLNGLEVSGEFSPSGGAIWLASGTAVEGEYDAIEVMVEAAGASAEPTGNSLSFVALENENVLGGFGFVADTAEGRVEVVVVGITTSSLYEVETSRLFIRGDANGDFTVDIGDPIAVLGILFSGEPPIVCSPALDANGDAGLDIADAIYLLSFLFSGGSAPSSPFPDPGGGPLQCL